MRDDTGERIAIVISYSQMSIKAVARAMGVSYQSLWACVNGTRPANLEMVQGICRLFPEIRERWILLGEGEMFQEKIIIALKKRGDL